MATKSILLAVADPQALVDITQALGAEWEATSVASEEDALGQLEQRSFDAFLVDFNLGSPDASELLNLALEKRPETNRFLLAYEADLALVAAKVLGSHQILPKPVEPASVKSRLESGVGDTNTDQSESDPASTVSEAPPVPAVYAEVLKALESTGVTPEQVGEIIARDEALTAEVLRLTNSSYLGLPQNVTSPVEAVESLGLETVKGLVMALQFLAEHSRLKPGYLSLGQVWEHSINVAQIARDLVLFETKDRALAAQALTAGLLHDLGKVVLATNFDDLYGRVHSLASKQPVTLWDVEKEMFGANHGEIGACLVGMWNMPLAIVDAAALHHEPPVGEQQQLTPLAAVHIANVIEHELQPYGDELMVAPIISTPFLNELGLLQRLPIWRAAFANRRADLLEAGSGETEQSDSTVLSSALVSRTGNQLPGPASSTRTSTSVRPGFGDVMHWTRNRKHWVYAAVAAGVLALLAIWNRTQPGANKPESVYARTPAPYEAPAVVPSLPAPKKAPADSPQAIPSTAAPAVSVASTPVSKRAASQPAPVPAAAAASPAPPVIVVPPPRAAFDDRGVAEYRVNGIIYSARPSAIVNGETVNVGDQVDGATVVAIGRTTVTLQINGQNKVYGLR